VLRSSQGSLEGRGRFGVDRSIYKVLGFSDSAKKVYVYLSKVADAEGYAFPFVRTIASRTGLSQSTVSKALRELEAARLVSSQQRYSRRGGSSKLYQVRKVAKVYPESEGK